MQFGDNQEMTYGGKREEERINKAIQYSTTARGIQASYATLTQNNPAIYADRLYADVHSLSQQAMDIELLAKAFFEQIPTCCGTSLSEGFRTELFMTALMLMLM